MFVDGKTLVRSIGDALSFDAGRMQPGVNGTLDFVVENGHAQGSFEAGRNIGIVGGVCEATLGFEGAHAWAAETTFLSPNTWISGLFGDEYRQKRERVRLFSEFAPPEIRAAIEESVRVDRTGRFAESIADATAMALYFYHRAWDEACVATFPKQPLDVIRLDVEVQNERDAPYRALFSTLRKDEVQRLLRSVKLWKQGDHRLSRGALAQRVRDYVLEVVWDETQETSLPRAWLEL